MGSRSLDGVDRCELVEYSLSSMSVQSSSSTLRIVEPAIQNYAWGKVGSASKVALLAKEGGKGA